MFLWRPAILTYLYPQSETNQKESKGTLDAETHLLKLEVDVT